MKKLSLILLAAALVVCMFVPVFAAPSTYLELKATASDIQPELSCKVVGLDGGATYTFYANIKFDSIVGTNFAYVAIYNYTVDHFTDGSVRPESFLDLGAWGDVAQCTAGSSQDWQEVSKEITLDDTTACTMINIGFYQAGGTIQLADMRIEDDDGNVVWSEDWSKGYDTDKWIEYVKVSQESDNNAYMKSIDLIGYTAPVAETTVVETEAPAAETAAPTVETAAPQTADMTSVLCAASLISLVAIAVIASKKRA